MPSPMLTIKTDKGHCIVRAFNMDQRSVYTECGKILVIAAVVETNSTPTCKRCAATCRVVAST